MTLKPTDGLQLGKSPDGATNSTTQEYIERGYAYGEAYVEPSLYEHGIYTYSDKPADFDNQCLVRETAPVVHRDVMGCSVSGHFIDEAVFQDENILMEILQNAEPADSKGSWFGLEFFAEGKWRSVVEEIGNFSDSQIEAVRIVDNGKGYLPTDMTTVGGGKRSDPKSAGRFGTGMKVSDRSALGKGVQVTRYSRNWKAVPFLQPVTTSAGHDYTVGYNVEFLAETYGGSVVEYRNLTGKMMTALRKISDYYLPLDSTLQQRILGQNQYGLVLSPKEKGAGEIMVKGRKYALTVATEHPCLFSYDLHDCVIDDQNRHFVDTSKVSENILSIWRNTNNASLFRQLLDASHKYHEHSLRGMWYMPQEFKQAFMEKFGITDWRKTYVKNSKTTEENEKILARKGYIGIPTGNSKFVTETLDHDGLKTGDELIKQITNWHYGPDNLSEFEGETFSSCACRGIALLDDTDLQAEVKEVVVVLEKEGKERKEVPFQDFLKNPKEHSGFTPVSLVIRFPNLVYSTKKSWTTWYHDEIFSPFFTACQTAGVKGLVLNGFEEAEPYNSGAENTFGRTRINVRTWPDHTESHYLQVEIAIENRTQAVSLRKLGETSLNLQPDYRPILITDYGDIVRLEGGDLYEKGLKRENYKEHKRILSYNVHDRVSGNATNLRELPRYVSYIISKADKPEIAKAILSYAKENGEAGYLEYAFVAECPAIWVHAFEEVFGEKTVMEDCGKAPTADLIKQAQETASIKTVTLNKTLTVSLAKCGVKKLSNAVQGTKFTEYTPTPIGDALLTVQQVVDRAVTKNLPKEVEQIKPEIKVVQSIENCYGQELCGENGYLNPFLTDPTIYLHEGIISKGQFRQIIYSILEKTLELHKPCFDEDEYLQFKARVIDLVDMAIDQGLRDDFKKRAKLERGKVLEVVERMTDLVEHPVMMEEDALIDQRKVRKRNVQATAKEERRTLMKDLQTAVKKMLTRDPAKKKEKPAKQEKPAKEKRLGPHLGDFVTVPRVIAVTAVAALAAIVYLNKDAIESGLDQVGQTVSSWVPDSIRRNTHEFVRGVYRPDNPIGVSIDRGRARLSNFDSGDDYAEQDGRSFITYPARHWGEFMVEQTLSVYKGKAWAEDKNQPDFDPVQYPKMKRFVHIQKTGKTSSPVYLRTMAGAQIDPDSIVLLDKANNQSKGYSLTRLSNGEYKVIIEDGNADAVLYHTLMPVEWEDDAKDLTDEDFGNLPREAYEYYTQVQDTNPAGIKFQSPKHPGVTTLAQFVEKLRTLSPYKRLMTLHQVVRDMRYTRTERTEKAFKEFHAGNLPEKDFLTFIFNSQELERPGDGDCDVQNTTFALIARLAGIPARLQFVITNSGVGHGPAEVYLPKIGWVLMDAMGDRSLIERISEDPFEVPSASGKQLSTEDMIELLNRQSAAKTEYDKRGCGKLKRDF